jgi:hypothetical protein
MILRGLTSKDEGLIRIDEEQRRALGVEFGQKYWFEIEEISPFGEFLWGWNATDPANRSGARLAVVSFWLGFVSLALGIFGAYLGWVSFHHH